MVDSIITQYKHNETQNKPGLIQNELDELKVSALCYNTDCIRQAEMFTEQYSVKSNLIHNRNPGLSCICE